MGTTERRRRMREARENEIIETARGMFVEKGYERTTIEEIAEKLEISTGTMYNHFDSKEELFYAAWNPWYNDLVQYVADLVEKKEMSGLYRHGLMGRWFAEKVFHDLEWNKLWYESPIPNDDAGPHGKENLRLSYDLFRSMAKLLEEGIADGSVRPDLDPMTTSLAMAFSLEGAQRSVNKQPGRFVAVGVEDASIIINAIDNMHRALIRPGYNEEKEKAEWSKFVSNGK